MNVSRYLPSSVVVGEVIAVVDEDGITVFKAS